MSLRNSKKLVCQVFDGIEPIRVPIHLGSTEKDQEARLGDVVVGRAWVPGWSSFLDQGGPFKRGFESLFNWVEDLDIESYRWPAVEDLVEKTLDNYKEQVERYHEKRFVVFSVLGPTEQSEYFCAPTKPDVGRRLQLSRHRFDFSALTKLRSKKASELYGRIASYVLRLVEAGAEIDYVDAVRVADDACSYVGPNYPRDFMDTIYLPWHRRLSDRIRRGGKYAILHADGDLLKHGLFTRLAECYDAFHPLDLAPKATLKDALSWIDLILEARRLVGYFKVFFTGLPLDLMFMEHITPEDYVKVPEKLLELNGGRSLVLANTHRPYPRRSFEEESVKRKIEHVRRLAENYGRISRS